MEQPKKRILIVDDEKSVLDGIRRILHSKKLHWKVEFVTNSLDALSAMRQSKYDIIISDLKMPGMNGVALLEKVKRKYPDTIRFMLSGYNDKELLEKAVRCVHQFIQKPCPPGELEKLIEQAFALRDRIKSDNVRSVLSNITSLPVMPASYQEVIELIIEPGSSSRDVGKAIQGDIGLMTKVLQVVNSAFYGLRTQIVDPIHAVSYLGLKTVEGLILSEGVFCKLEKEKICSFGVSGIQEHCIRVGALARKICNSINMNEQEVDVANMAGIMHDTGKIVLISKFADQLANAISTSRNEGISLWEVEQEQLGITHSELGGCLLELWGLPNVIIESATFHHDPWNSLNENFSVLKAVYIADTLDHMLCSGLGDAVSAGVNYDYLIETGMVELFEKWANIYLPNYQRECMNVG